MSEVVLNATKRTVKGRKVNQFRREGKLPAVMYGSHFDSTSIFMERHETVLALRGVSSSTIITVVLDGEEYSCLLQDIQKDYIRNEPLHIDFRVLTMGEAITAMVPLRFVGEASAVEEFGGVLVTPITEVEVEAKPKDLPSEIVVDVSGITDLNITVSVSDLVVGEGVNVLTDSNMTVASVAAMAAEEEEETEEMLDDDIEPEVIEKGKQEDEEIED
jgi:large subunit ribosomal protein L25